LGLAPQDWVPAQTGSRVVGPVEGGAVVVEPVPAGVVVAGAAVLAGGRAAIDIPGRLGAGHRWGPGWWRRRPVEVWSDAA
jgi:hypothetical protein